MRRGRLIKVLWLYMLLLKVKSDPMRNVNMDTSALFHDDNNDSENYHVGDLNVGEHLITDDISDIVLTVGELVEMYNSEDPLVNTDSDVEVINPELTGKTKFERLQTNPSSKQTQSEITVDFRDVAGEHGVLVPPVYNSYYFYADAGEEKKCVEKVVLEEETEWEREVKCHHRYFSLWEHLVSIKDFV